MKEAYTYILSNATRTTFYIGVTNDIERRILEHKAGKGSVFTSKYRITDLMHYEYYESVIDAIDREKQLKSWKRQWKLNLIMEENDTMQDMAFDWFTDEEIKQCRKDWKYRFS